MAQKQTQDTKGFGLGAGNGKPSPSDQKKEQSGQNRLLSESEFNNPTRGMENE